MALLQLHYTSCENGLAGYSGFQFCAATQGVSAALMREVERQTIYEPPTSSLEAGQQTPVNLLYTFAEGIEAVIIARVEFTGLDFSNRLGNYFAHTLVSTAPGDDLRLVLPVELWDAPFWQSRQGAGTELPAVAAPPPIGPINRLTIADFLASGVCTPAQLATLLTAADHALNAGRQLLLFANDTDEICRLIAAIVYLLSPAAARRLTFSTYSYDPVRCRTHVVGSVPGTRHLNVARDAAFHTFNLVSGTLPDVPPSPASILLTRLGVAAAAEVWTLAAALGTDPDIPLGDALPMLASAALMLGEPLTADEVGAAIEWLSAAREEQATTESMTAAVSASLAQPLSDLPVTRKQQLLAIAQRVDRTREQEEGATSAAGPNSLASRIEAALVAGAMETADAGKPLGAGIVLHDPAARRAAAERCAARLAGADAGHALDLLAWASASCVSPAGEVIRQVGRRAVTPTLLATGELPGLAEAATAWPDLRAGIADGIADLPAADQQRLITGPAARSLRPRDFADHPELGEEWVIAQAHAEVVPPAVALTHVMKLRRIRQRDPVVDEHLLRRLWASDQWTVAEAAEVIRLPSGEIGTDAVTSRLAALLYDVPKPTAKDGWSALVSALAALPDGILPRPVAEQAAELANLIELIGRTIRQRPDTALETLVRRYGTGSPAADAFLRGQLPPLLIGHSKLGMVLASCPPPLFGSFCDCVHEAGSRGELSAPVIASLFVAMRHLDSRHHRYADLLSARVLAPMLPSWSRSDISVLGAHADRIARESSIYIDLWYLRNDQSKRFRLPRIRRRDRDG